ncbi:LacI family DNA-binding transcriptional regulator [Echinicola jeungdonensis]|uniref:LacI family DNA-binding transcriptional regulator n=1 Tax=Echinicola jeungdonensis TaxID=709343 RepID=A0ABV5J4U1_9BACT|nr:LacI family DNA-binding transcriptional regulator [Echinicola jeungdonensis]MDN3670650.1 LacI family DNA-binding transcriptional regulator [Echinicola jeungdonensis]
MSGVNIKQLAEALKLAPSTVSRALNDSYEISEKTKKRVLAMAEKMSYRPNPFARSLREHRSKTIAMIIPALVNNFFSQVIEGVEEIVQEYGYHLLVYNTHESCQKEREIVSHLLNGRVDGIMMSLSHQTSYYEHIQKIYDQGIPLIFFDRVCRHIPTTKFITNDYESGFKATEHLIEQGCKRIAFLLLSNEISIGKQRLRGYKDSLGFHGLEVEEKLILKCGSTDSENADAIRQLLNAPDRPQGILSSVEKLAISTYYISRDLCLGIPEDIKLASFSNLKIADLLNPGLTTIAQPALEIGQEAAKLLMTKLTKKNTPDFADQTITIPSVLEVRGSSGGISS